MIPRRGVGPSPCVGSLDVGRDAPALTDGGLGREGSGSQHRDGHDLADGRTALDLAHAQDVRRVVQRLVVALRTLAALVERLDGLGVEAATVTDRETVGTGE